MGNLEKPLTWILGIAFVGYLFMVNCECSEETTCPLNNGFNITNTVLNDGFNISNAGLNGDVLKADATETMEGTQKLTYFQDRWGDDSLDVNGERVVVEAIIIDSDTTVVTETNIDSTEVEIEEE